MAYRKPGRSVRAANRLMRRLRLVPVLAVPGRKTGRIQEVPINVLEHEGNRYLVSPRGETEWVRNLRAASSAELRRRSGSEPIAASEVPDDRKPDLIAAYRQRWDRETRAHWQALPDPADHPIFEIHPA